MTETGTRISVALVDDQPLFLAGIRMLIESQSDMRFCGEAANGEQAVGLASELRPDVMLMDLRMPVMDGVAATRRIISEADARNSDRPRIIALTTFNRDHAILDAVQAGASGYLLKSAEPDFLLAAIRTVHSGYSVIAPGSVHSLFEHAASRGPSIGPDLSVLDVLSVRERDVFLLVAKGLSNKDIAEALFISDATVKTHLRNVLDKLALRTRLQLIAYAHERRLLGGEGTAEIPLL